MNGTVVPLLRDLVDDAGLFPPAGLPMGEAVARYRRELRAAHPMLTHRFLCPASRFEELRAALAEHAYIRVGILLDDAVPEDDERIMVDLAEKALPAGDQAALAEQALADFNGFGVPLFLEPVRSPGWLDAIRVVSRNKGPMRGVKVRCGGLSADLFPSPTELAEFIMACAAENVPFKATAGLHHALPYTDPATGFAHFGYLGLVAAVTRAFDGAGVAQVAGALTETDPGRLTDGLSDRSRELLVSYGSCSTEDPVGDAVALGLATWPQQP
ncbi:MAG: hypothetical protein ABIS86_23605 [Streptosporangiaceae bacterium]